MASPAAPRFLCSAPGCGKAFQHAAWLRKHEVKHASVGTVPCLRDGCDKLFKSRTAMKAHVRTQHDNRYRYACPVHGCNKAFQDRRLLRKHHRQHGGGTGEPQKRASATLGRATARLMEALVNARKPTEAPAQPTVACCACGGRVPRGDEGAAFPCSRCQKWQHWSCGGLAEAAPELPQPLCCTCLGARSYRPTGLAEAALGREMAVAYAREQGGDVWRADPDGWCLLACVERACTPGLDRTALLQQALAWLSEGGGGHMLPGVQAAAKELLRLAVLPSRRQLDQRVARLWDSEVWDQLPMALSHVTGRALHVLSGDVRSGQVSLMPVDEGAAADASPVRLIRSGDEYGCAHYDLVEPQAV